MMIFQKDGKSMILDLSLLLNSNLLYQELILFFGMVLLESLNLRTFKMVALNYLKKLLKEQEPDGSWKQLDDDNQKTGSLDATIFNCTKTNI